MARRNPLRVVSALWLLLQSTWMQPTVAQDLEEMVSSTAQDLEEMVSSIFDAIIPELEDAFENITQQVGRIEDALENITQQVIDIDFSELLSNITIPEELMGAINVDVLFSEVFGGILAFFGIPGYEQYERAVDNPFYADPVPFGSQCTFCDGKFSKTKEFAGLNCEAWEIFAGFSRGEECSILRATAVKHCDCNMWGQGPVVFPPTCPLCKDQAQESKLFTFVGADRVLPSLSNKLRCSDILELPAVDGKSETCADIGQLAEFCGCEFVVPERKDQCTLCPAGTLPRHRDKIVLYGDDNAGTPNLTCAELHNKFANKEDSSVGDSSCNAAQRQLSSMLGADVRVFCGCPAQPATWVDTSVPIEHCEPCAPGYMVRLDGTEEDPRPRTAGNPQRVTCQDWGEEITTLSSDDPICTALTSSVMPGCCIPKPTNGSLVETVAFRASASSASFVPALVGGVIPGLVVLTLIR